MRTPLSAALLLLLLLLCYVRYGSAAEVLLSLSPTRSLSPNATGLWVLGEWPPKGTVTLPALQIVQVKNKCQDLEPALGTQARTLLVLSYSQCSDSQLYQLLKGKLSVQSSDNAWGVLLTGSDERGTVLHLANWASMPEPPSFPGTILTVAKSWGDRLIALEPEVLNSSTLSVRQAVTALALDTPVSAYVAEGHTNTYTYHHVDASGLPLQSKLTIAVTPIYGDPDLYVSMGGDLERTLHQTEFDKTEQSPGDDVMLLSIEASKPYVVIVVVGADPTEYTMVLSTSDSIVPLTNGQPKRYEAATNGYRYFSVSVDKPGEVRFAVTPLTGDPDLFVSTSPRPMKADAKWSSAEEVNSTRLHRYEHISIGTGDPQRCSSLPCTYHISVQADRSPSTYSVVASWGDQAVRLVEGVPQASRIDATASTVGSRLRRYLARVAGSNADLTLSLTLSLGSAKLYANINAPAGASPDQHKWSSEPVTGADERLVIPHTDPDACTDCDVSVAVVCQAACEFTLTSRSTEAITVLEDGAPMAGIVNAGAYEFFKLYLSDKKVDLELVLTVFSGNPDVYASVSPGITRPNSTHFDFASEDAASDVLVLTHNAGPLVQCQARLDTCIVYISVRGTASATASSYSLLATSYSVSSAFKVLSPPIAAEYAAYPADFGPSLPRTPLFKTIVYAQPGHACAPLVNAEALRGNIALIDRGPRDDEVCPMPNPYFANKVARVQAAGAVAAVVANDREGDLVFMGAVSGDQASQVAIPSLFVSKETGDKLKKYLRDAGGVLAQIAAPAGRVPLLVAGSPQHGIASHSQWRFYELITPAGSDDIAITVAPDFGNPDLFVSIGSYPDSLHYTWSAEASGADTLTISGDDSNLCRLCVLVVGVLGRSSDTAFTVMYSSTESLTTLQAGVPLVDQRLIGGTYAWYRVWVGSSTSSMTVAVTGRGDVDLYFSFTHERPRKEGHAYERKAAGRNNCDNVDCGATIYGGDAIHIPSGDSSICGGGATPCLGYIGVTSADNTTYTLLASTGTADRATPLVDGVGVSDAVQAAGGYRYYTVRVSPDVSDAEAGSMAVAPSVSISVTPITGDPDLYVLGPLSAEDPRRPDRSGKGCEGAAPPPKDCGWSKRSTNSAGETLVMQPPNASACIPSCIYSVAVYGFSKTAYTISAVSDPSAQTLVLGSPAVGAVAANGVRRFALRLPNALARTAVVLTPFSGNPSLYARFGAPPLATNGSVAASAYASEAPVGIEVLDLPEPPEKCGAATTDGGDSCVLHLAVRGESASSYSVLATDPGAPGSVALVDGQPQAGIAPEGTTYNYSFVVLDASKGYSLTMSALDGNPWVLTRAGRQPMYGDDPQTYAGDARHPIEVASAGGVNEVVRIYVMVLAGQQGDARWSIAVHASGGSRSTMLQDRVPLLVSIPPGAASGGPFEGASFSAAVPAGDHEAHLCFTALQGRVRAKATGTSSPGDSATHGGGGFCSHLVAGSHARVTLTADLSQSAPSRVSALLLLSASNSWGSVERAPPIDLQDGVPQRLRLGGHPEFFRISTTQDADSGQHVTFAAAVADGSASELTMRVLIRSISRHNMTVSSHDHDSMQEFGSAFSAAGGVASLTLSADLLSISRSQCVYGECEVVVKVAANPPAETSVTATSSGSPTLLPLGVTVGGAMSVEAPRGKLPRVHYELLLDPASVADDTLGLQLQRCAGDEKVAPVVRLSTSAAPPQADEMQYDFGDGVVKNVLTGLAHATKAYLSVEAASGALDYIVMAYANPEEPGTGMLSEPVMEEVALSYRGSVLSLTFAEPPLPASLAGSSDGWVRTYEVWHVREQQRLGANMHAWCGVGRVGVLLGSASSAELLRPTTADAKATMRLPLTASGHMLCAGSSGSQCLRKNEVYMLTVVAVSAAANANRSPPRRAVLTPLLWKAGHSHGGGGLGFWGGFFLFFFIATVIYVGQVRRAWDRSPNCPAASVIAAVMFPTHIWAHAVVARRRSPSTCTIAARRLSSNNNSDYHFSLPCLPVAYPAKARRTDHCL